MKAGKDHSGVAVLALFTGALVLTRGAAKGIKQPITSLVERAIEFW
jgi:hypothetical protein